MPNVTVTTDVDNLLKSADNAAARTSLGLGTAAEAATGDFATAAEGILAGTALQDASAFATAAEGILAGTALQPADPTLDSVTTNGATTNNDVNLGRITTDNNTATGTNAIAIGGTNNSASNNSCEVLGETDQQPAVKVLQL